MKLGNEPGDDLDRGLCNSCLPRPETRRLGSASKFGETRWGSAREFTEAEISLISKISPYMPAGSLLAILNERLQSDLGPDASRYTLEQLQETISASNSSFTPVSDFAGTRRVLAQARRGGVLQQITEQLIDDFAVVFSLNAKQVTTLKDILLRGRDTGQPS